MWLRTRNEPSSGARHHAVFCTVCNLVLNSAGNAGGHPTVAWLGVVPAGYLPTFCVCMWVRNQLWRQPSSRAQVFLWPPPGPRRGDWCSQKNWVPHRSWLASEARGGNYGEGHTSHTLILVPGIKFSLPWKYVIHRDVKQCDRQRPPPSRNLYSLYQCMEPCSKQPLGWPQNVSTGLSGVQCGADSHEASVDSVVFFISSRLWLLALEISVFSLEWFMTTSSQGVSEVTWSGYLLLGKIIM